MSDKPTMPVDKIVGLIAEGCADYADGDDPGHFKIELDAVTGELVISYAPDADMDGTEYEAQFSATEYRFAPPAPPAPPAPAASGLGWPTGGAQ